MLSGAGSVEEYIGNIRQAMLDMLEGSSAALEQFHSDVDDTDAAAGVNTEDFAEQVSQTIGEMGDKAKQTTKELHKLSEELLGEFKTSLQEALNWEDQYAEKMKAAIEANEKFIQSLNDMIARLAVLESSNPELKAARAAYMAAEAKHEKFVQDNGDVYDKDWDQAKQDWNDYLNKYIAQFASGGYTGEWGKEGKLAILHEKETILNEPMSNKLQEYMELNEAYKKHYQDTLINLSNTEAEIIKMIQSEKDKYGSSIIEKSLFDQYSKELDYLISAMSRPQITPISIPTDYSLSSQTLDQNVHIDASFPNVTDHNEIEVAFDNLINKATQYANRKNMSAMTFQDMYISKF